MARLNTDLKYEDEEDLYTDPTRQANSSSSSHNNNNNHQNGSDSASSPPSPSVLSDKENSHSHLHKGKGKEKMAAASATKSRNGSAALASKRASTVESRGKGAAPQSRSRSTRTASTATVEEEEEDEVELEQEEEEEEEEEQEDEDMEVDSTAESEEEIEEEEEEDGTAEPELPRTSKKRKSDAIDEIGPHGTGEDLLYDPDQDPEERREVRRLYRDLGRDVADNATEYLKPDNDKLVNVFKQANGFFKRVKQTADATLDSGLLVNAARLAEKRATNLTSGASGNGLDIDEFITNFIQYSKKSPNAISVQYENALDWAYIGKKAAARASRRPPTSDFMLGPLGITKKVRIIKERKKIVRRDMKDAVRPEDLDAKKIAQSENSTTKNVYDVNTAIDEVLRNLPRWPAKEKKVYTNTHEEDESPGLQINYFRFVINPKSYSQTVENVFYTSFLVRDGRISLRDVDGTLYVTPTEPVTPEEAAKYDMVRKQIVMPMSKKTWRQMIRAMQLDKVEPLIPTRKKEEQAIGASGWYS